MKVRHGPPFESVRTAFIDMKYITLKWLMCQPQIKLAINRFWKRVIKTESCWIWVGPKSREGYGELSLLNGELRGAHRLSWILHYGSLYSHQCVLHHCDNPACVNPIHLFIGSHHDNMLDAKSKGRMARGERSGRHKLKSNQVIEIRSLYSTGRYTHRSLAQQFGVRHCTVGVIIRLQSWKHLTGS